MNPKISEAAGFWLDFLRDTDGEDDAKRIDEMNFAISNISYVKKLASIPQIEELLKVYLLEVENIDFRSLVKALEKLRRKIEIDDNITSVVVQQRNPDEGGLVTANRIARSHINQIVVQFIEEKLPFAHISSCRFPADDLISSNRLFFSAPRQSKYLSEICMLAWKAYFKHGVATCIMMADSHEFEGIRHCVKEFNFKILEIIERELENSPSRFYEQCVVASNYCLHPSSSDMLLTDGDIFTSSVGRWRNTRALIRICVAPSSSNQIGRFAKDVEFILGGFGMCSSGKFANMMVVDCSRRPSKLCDIRISSGFNAGVISFSNRYKLNPSAILNPIQGDVSRYFSLFIIVTTKRASTFLSSLDRHAQILYSNFSTTFYGFGSEVKIVGSFLGLIESDSFLSCRFRMIKRFVLEASTK
jgi:hypothetical protein